MLANKLTDPEFERIAQFIHESTGIHYTSKKKYLIENRLCKRVDDLRLSSYDDYLELARENPVERERLFNAITTGETSFFRNLKQMEVLNDVVIPELIAHHTGTNRQKIRIWSSASSTGEEIYSIAMLINEHHLVPDGWEVELIATDINNDVLEKAREGVYSKYTLRNTPLRYIQKYLQQVGDDQFKIRQELLPKVQFEKTNLMEIARQPKCRDFDVVFCCNVLIYFSEAAKKKVIADIHKTLADPGFFFIGHSESLHNVSKDFTLMNAKGIPIYRKG